MGGGRGDARVFFCAPERVEPSWPPGRLAEPVGNTACSPGEGGTAALRKHWATFTVPALPKKMTGFPMGHCWMAVAMASRSADAAFWCHAVGAKTTAALRAAPLPFHCAIETATAPRAAH